MSEIKQLKTKLNEVENKEKIEILCQISDLYFQKLNYDKSLAYLQEALQLAQSISDDKYVAICYHKMGLAYWRRNEFSRALHYFNKALPMYKKLDNKSQVAKMEMSIGVTLNNLGETQKAKFQLRKAVHKIIRARNKKLLANAYNWLGIVYNELNESENAMKYFMKGLVLQEKLQNKIGIGIAKNSIGLLHLNSNHYDQAEKLLLESLQIRKEIDDKMGIADCLNNLGMLFKELKNYEKSLYYYKQSLDIRTLIGGKAKMSHTHNNLGNIYAAMGKYEEAFKHHTLSLKLRKETGNKINILQSKQNICSCLLENDQIETAKKYLDECINELNDADPLPTDSQTYQLKMMYYEKIGDFPKAYENQTKFYELKTKLDTEENSVQIMELQKKYEMEKQIQENRFLQFKNGKLQKANNKISKQYKELKTKNDHIELTNKILRHDIINNLSVMNSALNLYNDSENPDYLAEIPKQIEKSINLIRKLRKLSKLLNHQKKLFPVDLRKDIFEKLVQNYSNLKIEINGKGVVLADQMLESVFDNLFSNAVKHSQTAKILIDILDRKRCIQINFTDFGIGIPQEIKDKIFEESYSYGETGNTGLGLFIVKKTIQNYGGSILVEDHNPQGTVFVIKLKSADKKIE